MTFYGPGYWRFIHYFSMNNVGFDLMNKLGTYISCDICKLGYYPPNTNENLVDWSLNLHNSVNKKLGRFDEYNIEHLNICQKNICDICTNNSEYNFPWMFIHNVAEQNTIETVSFLKEFNLLYPCSNCQGNLFPSEKLENERVLDWTLRNNEIKENKKIIYYGGLHTNYNCCSSCNIY